MDWWRKLKKNSLARFGGTILIIFYAIVILADFVAPYHPVEHFQVDGSLLPPTQIFWRNPDTGAFIGPHVYPTTQGPTDLETGDRLLTVDFSQPSPLRLFVRGTPYKFLYFIPLDIHLFGTVGEGFINLLGTDEQGRDQFSRLIFGGRISLSIGLLGIAISFPLGMFVGGISGYFGGIVDSVLMRMVEVLMTIPTIYLLVALAAILPMSMSSAQRFVLIIVITSFVSWSGLARVVRGQVLSIKEREFVDAARVIGASSPLIIVRHILPQTATYIIISATLAVPGFIVAESVLSLIGLGIQQPDPSWGNLLSVATNASILVLQPWLVWSPAALVVLTVLAFNLLGDGLRDALDPRTLQKQVRQLPE
ncbi:ABC transporter permease [Spirulina subsalsa]|uniref:ABC transporter permease n=1 Tax=Spirulina subsalsa TaxID=54311 RepID=UPI0002EF87DF|nr:ABC transporter permease [Spirulina subsalsa]